MSLFERLLKLSKEQLAEVLSECSATSDYSTHEIFDDMLDDVYGQIKVCGYEYAASKVFKETDPIAYDCSFSDWVGTTDDYIQIEDEFYSSNEVEQQLQIKGF